MCEYEYYYQAKSKQKLVLKKLAYVLLSKPAKRLYLDLSKISKRRDIKNIGKQNWLMIINEFTHLKFSSFYETKNTIVEPTYTKLHQLKTDSYQVKYIRCDNAGENKSVEKRANSLYWKLNIKFEYTVRDTPTPSIKQSS